MHVPLHAVSITPRGIAGPSARATSFTAIQQTPEKPAAVVAFARDHGRRGE
jgi:hypothetical protein